MLKRGEVYQVQEIPQEFSGLVDTFMEIHRKAFRAKFGRDPGPDDPLFFDPDAAQPQAISEKQLGGAMTEMFDALGVDDAYRYAYNKTGYMVTEMNRDKIPPRDLAAFEAAYREFEEMFGPGGKKR